jgi:hypothetical protein
MTSPSWFEAARTVTFWRKVLKSPGMPSTW